MKVVFLSNAFDQYVHWQDRDRKSLTRLNRLIEECRRHPYEGTGKPEPLKNDYSGWWSRRIDRENRLVYRVEGDSLIIIQCRYHY
ncbi:Txe/YoeB family addiction module toxin [Albidovulum sp.]|uniref:Txe/YoeB family addiction module toxin n=1 Tax=Albidovulum sp. TaxID=1872424 RepID=UPI0039B83877